MFCLRLIFFTQIEDFFIKVQILLKYHFPPSTSKLRMLMVLTYSISPPPVKYHKPRLQWSIELMFIGTNVKGISRNNYRSRLIAFCKLHTTYRFFFLQQFSKFSLHIFNTKGKERQMFIKMVNTHIWHIIFRIIS